ncbi:MAG: hypothetical protein V1704_01650 [Candidatus Vogelbacteria bacterium]
MNKKILIIIVLLVVAFAIGGYFYKDTYYYNSAIKNSNPSTCSKITKDITNSNCLAKIAFNKEDASICTNSPKMYIMQCFSLFAEMNGNITKCQEVTPAVDEYNCYTAFANTKRSTLICDTLTGEKKDYCYQAVAIANNDISICDNLPTSSVIKAGCASSVKHFNP